MKQLLYITVFLCTFSLQAQEAADDYRPFIEDGKEWLIIGDYLGEVNGRSQVTVWRNYIEGDTVISGHLCKKWFQEDSGYNPERKVETLAVYAYEENKKVWFFHEEMTTPELMFDFGAEVGDTLRLYNVDAFAYRAIHQVTPELLDSDMRDTVLITKKDVGKVGDLFEKRIWFTSTCSRYYPSYGLDSYNYLMEGVGFWSRPNWNFPTYPGMRGSLICCLVGEEILYFDTRMAEGADVPIPTTITSHPIISYPNVNCQPVNHHCFDLSGRPLATPSANGVYIMDGKKVTR